MPILVVRRRTPACSASRPGATAFSSAIAPSGSAVLQDVLLEQCPDFRECLFLGETRYVVRASQRNLGHSGRLDRQGAEVFRLQAVHVGLAAGPGEHLSLESQGVQEVVDALGRLDHLQALAQLGVLGGDADWAAPGVAVVTAAGRDSHGALVVGDAGYLLVAVQRHQRGVPDGDGLGAKRQALGNVRAVADAAGHDKVNLVDQPDVFQRPPGLRNRRHQRDAGLLRGHMRPRPGPALGAVQVNDVRAALGRHPYVVVDACGAELQLDRNLIVGGLADLLDLQRQVVGAEPVRVACGTALIDPGRQRAHLGDLLGDLLPHQVAAKPDLAALPDEELDAVGEHEMVRVEPVPALDDLVVPLDRQIALGRDHSTLTRAGGRAGHRGTLGQRHLRLKRQRAEAHPGDVNRDVELKRMLGEACAEHGLRLALLAVALDDEPGQRAGQQHQLVPMRDRLEHREAAHPVPAELGLHVNVVDHLGGEDAAVPEHSLAVGVDRGHLLIRLSEDELAFGRLEIVVIPELAPAHELAERAGRLDSVNAELAGEKFVIGLRELGLDAVDPERSDLPADVDRAVVHRVAKAAAHVAADNLPAALEHEPRHRARVTAHDDRAALLVDARARPDVAADHDVAAAQRRSGQRPGVLVDQDHAGHHVLGGRPADPAGHADLRPVDQAAAEVAEAALDGDRAASENADGDRVLGPGIEYGDVLDSLVVDQAAQLEVDLPGGELGRVEYGSATLDSRDLGRLRVGLGQPAGVVTDLHRFHTSTSRS